MKKLIAWIIILPIVIFPLVIIALGWMCVAVHDVIEWAWREVHK